MTSPVVTWAVVGVERGQIVILLDGEQRNERVVCTHADFPAVAADLERIAGLRWVWSDTAHWYPMLLGAGVRVQRVHDLWLCHRILRLSLLANPSMLGEPGVWDVTRVAGPTEATAPTLFDDDVAADTDIARLDHTRAEFVRQRRVLEACDGRLRLLTIAESAGALIAAEMRAAGLPWSRAVHEQILEEALGVRAGGHGTPARMAALASEIRALLGDPSLSLESQPKLLRALRSAGIFVQSTSKWELREIVHPVVVPLLEYKRMSRLYAANGWAWLNEWAPAGRFRPVYVPGGVVTGRWASSGGGALQLPRQLRPAVRADAGWTFVVADVSQLEPRVLAAMSGDIKMADAARGKDLYAGLVDAGVMPTREDAKIGVLGAMYGATSGESGQLVPKLRRAYPKAMGMVDDAARTGERGGQVMTRLGRTSPAPLNEWLALQAAANSVEASELTQKRAQQAGRDRGRFTRNFIVQGTAAEWALIWLAEIRVRLMALDEEASTPATASGPAFSRRAHLAFFLHDEIIVHTPAAQASHVAEIVQQAADAAARTLFQDFPLDFLLDLQIANDAQKH